jgi:hypothetical protein
MGVLRPCLLDDIRATLGEEYELILMPSSINIHGRRYEY